MALGLLGILVSLALLITLAYRGVTIVVAAPLSALVAMLFSGAPILANYTEIFMPALANFIGQYFPMFLTGAIFGKLMTMAGYATDIARVVTRWLGPKRALLATVLTTALLTYGGISVFVVVFVMFPLARELFRAADIPRRLIPGAIAHGMLTFTMTALPGSPQVQNIIPGQAFQTTTFAAPGLGILGGTFIFILGMLWLEHRKRQLTARGEHFADPTALELRSGAGADIGAGAAAMSVGDGSSSRGSAGSSAGQTRTSPGPGATTAHDNGTGNGTDSGNTSDSASPARPATPGMLTPPNHVFPFIPVLLVFLINFGCTMVLFPLMDWGYLQDERYGGIGLGDRAGAWAVLTALAGAILAILAMNARHLRWILQGITDGARNALLPIFNTASEVGYGAVVASLAAFALIREGIFGVSENALVASAVSTSTISAVTGSASGGMTIALNALGEELRDLAVDQGISLEAMHRITAMASGGLDSMPHNGAVITLIIVCGMTHRESYKDVGVVSLVIPVLVTAALIPLVLAVGSF
ncbi:MULTISPECIES: GntP family permease [Actinomycetes]|uniref:GntP family permease n=2 Tax=Actinomycetes TaxID=1760 RepID=A0ABP6M4A2_9MICC